MEKRINLPKIDRASLGGELFKWRTRKDLLQREAAEMMGVSRYTIIRIERGDESVSIATLYRVMNRLTQELRKEGGNL